MKFITYGTKESEMVRKVHKPRIKFEHNSTKVRQSLLYSSICLYGLLEYDLRLYNPKKLSKHLKENMNYIFPHDNIMRQHINVKP